MDSTIVRAHQHAAGARRDPAGQVEPPGVELADHALGRSRGGWTTTLHLACEQGRRPLSMAAHRRHRADSPQFVPVLERIRVLRVGRGDQQAHRRKRGSRGAGRPGSTPRPTARAMPQLLDADAGVAQGLGRDVSRLRKTRTA
ncbi:hypothetical protein GCM10009559_28840 [Pseudonocardia zijingensis]|uniref:DDE family transposase n=1 Tax=Pseudonocardia zijingensis TaxID=153376 RepID=A0ABN1Q2Q3_9PSEU